MQNISMMLKNLNFGQQYKFWSRIEILIKKYKFCSIIDILIKNRNFGRNFDKKYTFFQASKFWCQIKALVKNIKFSQKSHSGHIPKFGPKSKLPKFSSWAKILSFSENFAKFGRKRTFLAHKSKFLLTMRVVLDKCFSLLPNRGAWM